MEHRTAEPILYGILKEYARENRKNMTTAEYVLWQQIRARNLGVNFLRQHIIYDYIVDFVCLDKHLVIEVDGGYHSEPRQQVDDKLRESDLNKYGFKVIRFSNEQIIFDIQNVIEIIKQHIK